MTIIVGLALGLIIAGLVMCWLSSSVRGQLLQTVVYWVGAALVVIGLLLLLTPVMVWITSQLRAMLGV